MFVDCEAHFRLPPTWCEHWIVASYGGSVFHYQMGLFARKLVLGVSDQIKFKPVCSATDTSQITETLHVYHVKGLHFQRVNKKGANQPVQMRMLVCVFVVQYTAKSGFFTSRPIFMGCTKS